MPRQRRITWNGTTLRLCEWARRYGLNAETLRARLNRGADIREAIEMPRMTPRERGRRSAAVSSWR